MAVPGDCSLPGCLAMIHHILLSQLICSKLLIIYLFRRLIALFTIVVNDTFRETSIETVHNKWL